MKSPKLIGGLTDAAPIGFAQARALQQTGAPYLTSTAPGVRTRLKNGSVEVETFDEAVALSPYLWASSGLTGVYAQTTTSEPSARLGTRSVPVAADGLVGNLLSYDASQGQAHLWVGGRMLTVRRSSASEYWPVLMRPTDAREVLPGDALEAKRAISFVAAASAASTSQVNTFASGADARGHRWGMAYTTGVSAVRDHWVLLGSSGDTATSVIALPAPLTAGAYTFRSRVFCTGFGRLMYFSVEFGGVYFHTSTDHGETWASADATFLRAWLTDPGGDTYDVNQSILVFPEIAGYYLGDGKSLFMFPALGTAPATIDRDKRWQFRCFVHDSVAGTFTNLAWPGEDPSFFNSPPFIRLGGGCFGQGCLAILCFQIGDPKVAYTTDFGSTWTVRSAPFASQRMAPITVAPYVSPARRGSILFAVPRDEVPDFTDTSGTDVWRTDGSFAQFKKVGPIFGSVTAGLGIETYGAVPFLNRSKARPELGEF